MPEELQIARSAKPFAFYSKKKPPQLAKEFIARLNEDLIQLYKCVSHKPNNYYDISLTWNLYKFN